MSKIEMNKKKETLLYRIVHRNYERDYCQKHENVTGLGFKFYFYKKPVSTTSFHENLKDIILKLISKSF